MTPLRPLVYIAADVVANLLMVLVGMAGVVIVGWSLYRVEFEGHAVSVLSPSSCRRRRCSPSAT